MPVMLERWNDDKMDALSDRVDERFEQVDKRFEQIDRRFEQVDKRFEQVDKRFEQVYEELRELRLDTKAGFERTHRLMIQGILALSAAYMAGFAGLIGLVATQL